MILVNGWNHWVMLNNNINGNKKQRDRRWRGSAEWCCGHFEVYHNIKRIYAVGSRPWKACSIIKKKNTQNTNPDSPKHQLFSVSSSGNLILPEFPGLKLSLWNLEVKLSLLLTATLRTFSCYSLWSTWSPVIPHTSFRETLIHCS